MYGQNKASYFISSWHESDCPKLKPLTKADCYFLSLGTENLPSLGGGKMHSGDQAAQTVKTEI